MNKTDGAARVDPFDATTLGPATLRNCFVKAATFEDMAADNLVTDRLIELHRVMAAGGLRMTPRVVLAALS